MKKIILLFSAILSLLLLGSSILSCSSTTSESSTTSPSDSQQNIPQIILTLHHVTANNPGDPPTDVSNEFARRMDIATNGRVLIKVYGEGEIYSNTQAAAVALASGELDFAVINCADIATSVGVPEYEIACRVPTFGVDWHDLLKAYEEFWADPDGGGVIDELWQEKGIKILGTHTSGYLTLSSNKKATSLNDWSGLKIRYPGAFVYEAIVKSVGATPVQMSWTDAQMALKTGTVDGIITDSSFFRARLWELSSKYLVTNVSPFVVQRELVVSPKALAELPEDIRDTLLNTIMPEFNEWCKEWNITYTENVVKNSAPYYEGYEFSETDITTAQQNIDAITTPYFQNVSPDLLAVWNKTIEKYK